MTRGGAVADDDGAGEEVGTSSERVPPGRAEADWAATMPVTSAVVVLSNAWSASVGALATCVCVSHEGCRRDDRLGGWGTYRLCPRVWGLDEALCDCTPDVVGGDVGVCPGYGKEGRVPAHHRRRLFVSLNEVIQADALGSSVPSTVWVLPRTHVSGAYDRPSSRRRFHSRHCSGGART